MPISMDQEEAVGRTENQQIGRSRYSDNTSGARSPQLDIGELIIVDK